MNASTLTCNSCKLLHWQSLATLGFNWKYNIIWILFTFGVLLVPVAPPDPLVADDALAITAVSADKH